MVFKSKPVAFQTYLTLPKTHCIESRLKTVLQQQWHISCHTYIHTEICSFTPCTSCNHSASRCPLTPDPLSSVHLNCLKLLLFHVLSIWPPPKITFPWQSRSAAMMKWGKKTRKLVIILENVCMLVMWSCIEGSELAASKGLEEKWQRSPRTA